MSTKVKITLVALVMALVNLGQDALAQFTITGEMRTRSWLDHGERGLAQEGSGTGFTTLQRTRLYADYKGDNVGAHVSFQDIREWGVTPQLWQLNGANMNGRPGIFEGYGWFTLDSIHTIKIGRQVISYDDQRFWGGLGWLEQGRTQDAFKYSVASGKSLFEFTAALGGQGIDGTYTGADYQHALIPYFKQTFEGGSVGIIGTLASYRMAGDSSFNKFTIGVTPSYKISDDLKLDASFYFQGGERNYAMNAAGIQAYLGVTTTAISKVTLTLGGEFLSGDDASTTDVNEQFTPDFGTNHKFNGLMDHFYVGAAPSAGLVDLHLKSKIKTSAKTLLVANAHYFMAASSAEDAYGTEGQGYGSEVDLVFVYKPVASTAIKLGYSQFFATETMEAYRTVGGGEADSYQGWAWLMVSVKPTFFKN